MYYCTRCNKRHRKTSKLGKEHRKYMMTEPYFCEKCGRNHNSPSRRIYVNHIKHRRENPIPLVALATVAPMAIDVGKEIVKDPKLITKPFGVVRAVGRSFGLGKDNPPFTDFEKRYGKRIYPEIKVVTNKNNDYNASSLIYYRFTKNEPNVSIIYDEKIRGVRVFFIVNGVQYTVTGTQNGLVNLVDENGQKARIGRDNYSWILYPPYGKVETYTPLIPDEIPPDFGDFEYESEELSIDWNPRRNVGWSSLIKAAKPLIKKAVPIAKRGVKYIAKHPELITSTGEALSTTGKAVESVVATARGEPHPPQPPQPSSYPPSYPPHYYPYPRNPKRNPKKIDDLQGLYEFIGGEYND